MDKLDALYQKIAQDNNLQEKLKEIINKCESEGSGAVKSELVNFAQGLGYDVTYEEIRVYFQSMTEEKARELADIELDLVAGGKGNGRGEFILSIMSLGLYCLVMSIDREIKRESGCELD